MSWTSVVCSTSSFVFRPLATLFNLLLLLLAPLIYLITYVVHWTLVPIYILGRLESLYIYFGVAVLVGLVAGSVLHFSSSMLVSLFDLRTTPEEIERTASSIRAVREEKTLENVWEYSTPAMGIHHEDKRNSEVLKKEYVDFLDKGSRRDGQGILAQTILEEDDDSEDGV